MKVAIIWYFDKASWVFPNWRDGHRAAIEEIGKKHEIKWFLDKADAGEEVLVRNPDGTMERVQFITSDGHDFPPKKLPPADA